MNEQTGKTASSLAITEKKVHHRSGGCVGIFFQLYDWNKRFAKKKLFSRKLLPSTRTNATKSFGGDDKMPKSKLHLIADANSEGFPNVKRNSKHFSNVEMDQKHEMKSPGLVARLMGLESIPALNRDKSHKKSIALGSNSIVKDEKMVNFQGGDSGKYLDLAKSSSKIDSRPPKIQKIEPYDRKMVTRFGAEALHIKSVLSRSKRHHNHHQKFVSPVKSLRNASRTTRLMDAAAKILEPGLQATNRAKYTLAYSSSNHHLSRNEVVTEGIDVVSPDVLEQSTCNVSCKNCGNVLDVVESRAKLEDQPYVCSSSPPNFIDASSHGLEKSWPRHSPTSFDQGKEVIFQRSHDQPLSFTGQEESSVQFRNESDTFGSPLSREVRAKAQWHLTSQPSIFQKNEKSPVGFKPWNQIPNHISVDKDRISAKAKLSNLQNRRAASGANAVSGAKDFVVLNRSSSSHTRRRVPVKVDSSPVDFERKSSSSRDDSMSQLRSHSPVRKRRTHSVSGKQTETAGFIYSAIGKERNAKCNPVTRREMTQGACSMDRTCVKSGSTSQETGKGAIDKKDTGIVSFTFNSPIKEKHDVSVELKDKRKNQNQSIALKRSEILENNYGETSLPKNLPPTGDALSNLLEQKMKELTSQEDEHKTGCSLPKRSTAMILQELISALENNYGETSLPKNLPPTGDALSNLLEQKMKELISQEDEHKTGCSLPKRSTAMILQELISALSSGQPNSQHGHLFNSDISYQTEAKADGGLVGFASHGDHLSPSSVLEASFSNDSCVSSCLDESLGHRLQVDSMDYSYDEPQPMEIYADLLDSAASLDKETNFNEMIDDLVNRISVMLHVVSHFGLGLSGDKLIHFKEVILKAELLFGNSTPRDLDGTDDYLLAPYIHDELETLVAAMQVDLKSVLGIDQIKENKQVRGFLFDCAIECIDSKYGRYCNSGFGAWRSLPYSMTSGKLIRDVRHDVKRWTKLAGMAPDELIEYEMSYSLGKWTDFDIEAYECGVEMDWDILQNLVDEIVDDLVCL